MDLHQIFDVHSAVVNAKLRSKQIRAVMEERVVSGERNVQSGAGVTKVKETSEEFKSGLPD